MNPTRNRVVASIMLFTIGFGLGLAACWVDTRDFFMRIGVGVTILAICFAGLHSIDVLIEWVVSGFKLKSAFLQFVRAGGHKSSNQETQKHARKEEPIEEDFEDEDADDDDAEDKA